jgi:hypothetical protein
MLRDPSAQLPSLLLLTDPPAAALWQRCGSAGAHDLHYLSDDLLLATAAAAAAAGKCPPGVLC